MPFGQITGQEEAVSALKAAIKNSKVAHAYLFCGPQGSGKSLLAKAFAQALNCEQKENALCTCLSCRKIEKDSHPDITWIRKEEDDKEIKIEKIRKLQNGIVLKPYEGKYKVYVVINAELMSPGAANSFLKTLEEPPARSVIVLITENPKRLLPTIASRCQIIRLRPSPPDFSLLLERVIEEFSDDNCIRNYSSKNRRELSEKLSVLTSWYRDLLIFKTGGGKGLFVHRGKAERIKEGAMARDVGELMRILESVVNAKEKIDTNVNPKLALSVLFNEIG